MPNDNVKSLLEGVWGKRDVGIKAATDFMRSITKEEIEYLRNYRYPFLQIMNTKAQFSGKVEPVFVAVEKNKWVIFDYGDAMSVASPHDYEHKIAKEKIEDKKDDGESGGGSGAGTIVQQQHDSVFAMIELAKQKGWAAIEVIDGTNLMQFYAWIAAQESEIELFGFIPKEEERRRYEYMKGVMGAMKPAKLGNVLGNSSD